MLVKAGTLMGIQILDHLIVGVRSFVSLKERRLGFEEDR
jgi:DNA repair protein RadC